MAKKSVRLYEAEIATLLSLPEEQRGKILTAILATSIGAELPEMDAMEAAVYTLVNGQVQRAEEMSKKRKQAVQTRWDNDVAPESNDTSAQQSDATLAANSTPEETDDTNVIQNDTNAENDDTNAYTITTTNTITTTTTPTITGLVRGASPPITADGKPGDGDVFAAPQANPKLPKPKPLPKPPKPEKLTLGEYKHVLLTEGELAKLKAEHTNTDEIIKFLDEYIEEKGYKSKSHYMAIGRWVVDAVEKRSSERAKYQPKQQQKKPAPKRDFTERKYSDDFYDKLFEQKGDA